MKKIILVIFVVILFSCYRNKERFTIIYENENNYEIVLIDNRVIIETNVETISNDIMDLFRIGTANELDLILLNEEIIDLKNYNEINHSVDYSRNGAIIDVIESGEKTWTIRYLIGTLAIRGWRENNIVNIYDNPKGNIIYRVRLRPEIDFVNVLAITKETEPVVHYTGRDIIIIEEHWVKILIDNDKSGWVFGNRLSAERGGPKYLTPENIEPNLGLNAYFDRYYVRENVMHCNCINCSIVPRR